MKNVRSFGCRYITNSISSSSARLISDSRNCRPRIARLENFYIFTIDLILLIFIIMKTYHIFNVLIMYKGYITPLWVFYWIKVVYIRRNSSRVSRYFCGSKRSSWVDAATRIYNSFNKRLKKRWAWNSVPYIVRYFRKCVISEYLLKLVESLSLWKYPVYGKIQKVDKYVVTKRMY